MEIKFKNKKKSAASRSTSYRFNDKTIGENLNFGATEAYKLLRTNLEFSLPDENACKIIGITSSLQGEGKSTTSINIAYTIMQTGKKVLLLEADLRRPSIAPRLGIQRGPGISNLMAGQNSENEIIQKSSIMDNLCIITAGDTPPNPAELLGSDRMKKTLEKLSAHFDVIIVDLPPVGVVSDALVISKLLSGIVVVCRQNVCTRTVLDDTVRKLRYTGCKLLGFVMTGSNTQKKSYGRYGDYESAADKVR